MDITQSIEILKELKSEYEFMQNGKRISNKTENAFILTISTLESLQQARDELGERQDIPTKHKLNCHCEDCFYILGYNKCYDLAEKIIAKKNMEVRELRSLLEQKINMEKLFCPHCSKSTFNNELLKKNEEIKEFRKLVCQEIIELKVTSETAKELLREFKERCSVEGIEGIIACYLRIVPYDFIEDLDKRRKIIKDIAQAISNFILEKK